MASAKVYERQAAEYETRAAQATDLTFKQLFAQMGQHYHKLAQEMRARDQPIEPASSAQS